MKKEINKFLYFYRFLATVNVDDMNLKDKLDYIEIVSKMILNFVKDYPDVENFMLKNKTVYTDKSTGLSVEITLKREM